MNMQDLSIIQLSKKSYRWFFHGNLPPEVTLTLILLGFGISFIHKAYLFLAMLNQIPYMFDMLNYIC